MNMSRTKLVAAVKEYAQANYEKGGWDVIVECWDDEQISTVIAPAKTLDAALKNMRCIVDVYAERQADAEFHRREAIGDY